MLVAGGDARLALDPGHVAACVEHDGLGNFGGAETEGDDVVAGVEGVPSMCWNVGGGEGWVMMFSTAGRAGGGGGGGGFAVEPVDSGLVVGEDLFVGELEFGLEGRAWAVTVDYLELCRVGFCKLMLKLKLNHQKNYLFGNVKHMQWQSFTQCESVLNDITGLPNFTRVCCFYLMNCLSVFISLSEHQVI